MKGRLMFVSRAEESSVLAFPQLLLIFARPEGLA